MLKERVKAARACALVGQGDEIARLVRLRQQRIRQRTCVLCQAVLPDLDSALLHRRRDRCNLRPLPYDGLLLNPMMERTDERNLGLPELALSS